MKGVKIISKRKMAQGYNVDGIKGEQNELV